MSPCDAVTLHCDSWPYRIEMADGRIARARTVLIATGRSIESRSCRTWRSTPAWACTTAATHLEGRMCQNDEIVVVGGGNSAGQAAVFLAGSCRHVHIMVRSDGLAETMSHYLIRRIRKNRLISLCTLARRSS